jgi:hypothetical protein
MGQLSRRAVLEAMTFSVACAALPPASASSGSASRALASPPSEVLRELPDARLYGSGRLRRYFFHVYDARLWTQPSFEIARFSQLPLALELQYGRELVGSLIAERSLEEMRRGAEITTAQQRAWLTAMERCFPDVVEGDRMTGVQLPGTAARFFVNGAFVGEVRDAEFTRLFFGIWLAPTTSEPELRAALLAGARGGS